MSSLYRRESLIISVFFTDPHVKDLTSHQLDVSKVKSSTCSGVNEEPDVPILMDEEEAAPDAHLAASTENTEKSSKISIGRRTPALSPNIQSSQDKIVAKGS